MKADYHSKEFVARLILFYGELLNYEPRAEQPTLIQVWRLDLANALARLSPNMQRAAWAVINHDIRDERMRAAVALTVAEYVVPLLIGVNGR